MTYQREKNSNSKILFFRNILLFLSVIVTEKKETFFNFFRDGQHGMAKIPRKTNKQPLNYVLTPQYLQKNILNQSYFKIVDFSFFFGNIPIYIFILVLLLFLLNKLLFLNKILNVFGKKLFFENDFLTNDILF